MWTLIGIAAIVAVTACAIFMLRSDTRGRLAKAGTMTLRRHPF
jgi:uncharacterized membrane protein